MRFLLLLPLAAALIVAGGLAACSAAGWSTHPREMLASAAVTLVSALLGVLPVILARNSDQATVAQAGLAGTVIHMFLALVLAAGLWMIHVTRDLHAFGLWLMAFYWAQLIAVVVVMVATVRHARPAPAAKPANAA